MSTISLLGTLLCLRILAFSSHQLAAQTKHSRLPPSVDEEAHGSLIGNVHPLARPEFDQGAVADAQPFRRMLLILRRSSAQEEALQTFLDEQQDKSSPNYHAWLTPEQFGKQFGPSDGDIHIATQWLTSHGFTDVKVAAGRIVIEFSGTVARVRSAFHTEIHRYFVNGEEHIANASDPQIPAALAPIVAGIASLHDFRKKPMYRLMGNSRTLTSAGVLGPANPEYTFSCIDFLTSIFGSFSGQSSTCHALGPYDFATIYNVLPLWTASPAIDGTGQTIAIVGRSNINVQDVADFRNLFGLPSNLPQIVLDGPDPGLVRGDEIEADLDVQWSGAVAKGATIQLVVSQSTETTDGVDLSALYIVDHNLAPVMTESYGQCEFNLGAAGNQFYYNLWQQAAAQGITVFVSSGDNGSAGCDFELDQGLPPPQPAQYGLAVNGIASTPYNVAVGGTDFNDYFSASTYWNATSDATTRESAKGYIPETTWNSSCTNAFLEDPRFRQTTSPETNCNNSYSLGTGALVVAVGGSGGTSNCAAPTGTTVSGSATTNSFAYTGREFDFTGLQFNRARYYNSQFQRFISEDPIGFNGGDVNLYAYTRNSPTNHTDRSGKTPAVVVIPILLGAGEGALAATGVGAAVVGLTGLAVYDGIQAGNLITAEWVSCDWCLALTRPDTRLPPMAGRPICLSPPDFPGWDPTQAPGPGWGWRGQPPVGGPDGNWYNPDTGESLHPDLDHPPGIDPHWDWKDPDTGQWWRLFPDGSARPK